MAQQLWGLSSGTRSLAMPMDAYRNGDAFLIQFDLPGIDPTIEDNVLTVKAERPVPPKENGIERLVSERQYGTFTRQVFLGDNLDSEHIEAEYEAGVLNLSIPVTPHAKPRRILVGKTPRKKQITS